VRVVIVDDHRLVRDGLRTALEDAGIEVVGEAADGLDAIELIVRQRPDVALLDVSMPRLDGIEAARRLRTRAPATRVVMLTMHAEERLVADAQSAGAVGYLVKDASTDDVVRALHAAMDGRRVLAVPGPDAAPVVDLGTGPSRPSARDADAPGSARDADTPGLTDRELQVLQALADGRSPGGVAELLDISSKTVRNHLTRVYAKLGVESRSQAIVEGLRLGILQLD